MASPSGANGGDGAGAGSSPPAPGAAHAYQPINFSSRDPYKWQNKFGGPPGQRPNEKDFPQDISLSSLKDALLKNVLANPSGPGPLIDDESRRSLLFSSFDNMAEVFDDVTDDGELKKRIIHPGMKGKTPPVYSRVWINYESFLEKSLEEPYDSKFKSKEKFSFVLFHTAVLPVLEFGIGSMEIKEKAHFLTTAKYAYGPLGVPDLVPPNCSMIFIITLLDYQEAPAPLPIYRKRSKAEINESQFKELKSAVDSIKTKANANWKLGKYKQARSGYYRAMYILQRPQDLEETLDGERNSLLFAVYNNMAICYLQSQDFEIARSYCEKALELPANTVGNRCKLYYRLAKAEYELGHFEKSKEYCSEALKLEPANKECRNLHDTVLERINTDSKVSKALYKKMAAKLRVTDSKVKDRTLGLDIETEGKSKVSESSSESKEINVEDDDEEVEEEEEYIDEEEEYCEEEEDYDEGEEEEDADDEEDEDEEIDVVGLEEEPQPVQDKKPKDGP